MWNGACGTGMFSHRSQIFSQAESRMCGVLNESRWMLNGFIMGSMGRRGCVFTMQKVIPVSKNERQWGVWNARNLIFVAKKGAPITARHDDRQGGRGKSGSSMAWLNPMTFLDPMTFHEPRTSHDARERATMPSSGKPLTSFKGEPWATLALKEQKTQTTETA